MIAVLVTGRNRDGDIEIEAPDVGVGVVLAQEQAMRHVDTPARFTVRRADDDHALAHVERCRDGTVTTTTRRRP